MTTTWIENNTFGTNRPTGTNINSIRNSFLGTSPIVQFKKSPPSEHQTKTLLDSSSKDSLKKKIIRNFAAFEFQNESNSFFFREELQTHVGSERVEYFNDTSLSA